MLLYYTTIIDGKLKCPVNHQLIGLKVVFFSLLLLLLLLCDTDMCLRKFISIFFWQIKTFVVFLFYLISTKMAYLKQHKMQIKINGLFVVLTKRPESRKQFFVPGQKLHLEF